MRATPSRHVEQLDAAAVRVEVRAHLVERLHDALVERHRVEVVDQEEAGDDAVVGHRIADRRGALARVLERLDDAAHALAVELDDRADELLGGRLRARVAQVLQLRLEDLNPLDELFGADVPGAQQLNPVGVCWTFRTMPFPLYMCTPHGRHGSKLRTARMMSTPLKFSGPFSSKMGVFCTASS